MKVQRIISSTFIFISAFIAVAYSAAYFSEDELMNQIHEDLLLAKLFNRMQAREQGMTMSASFPPYSSPTFLPGRSNTGKASQQRKLSIGSTLVSPKEAWLQEIALQQFFPSRLFKPIKDVKYRHASGQHKKNSPKMATAVEGRVQDYIKTLDQKKLTEQGLKLLTNLFTCSIGSLPDFVESLKGTKIFGIPTNRLLEGFKILTDGRLTNLSFFQKFIRLVPYILDPDELVAKDQVSKDYFQKLRDIFKGGLNSFTDISKQKGESEIFRNLLNIASGFVSSGKFTSQARFTKSINFFIEKYFFEQIDSMDKSEEEKTAMKKALSGAVNTVVTAIFKMWNKEDLNPDNRTSLLRSVITVLVSLINGFEDTPLLRFINQFLASNPNNEELSTKSQCLIALFLRKSLENLLFIFEENQHTADGTGPGKCAVNLMIDVYRIFLEYIPTRVSNAGGCEDFAAIGYRGVAQLSGGIM